MEKVTLHISSVLLYTRSCYTLQWVSFDLTGVANKKAAMESSNEWLFSNSQCLCFRNWPDSDFSKSRQGVSQSTQLHAN